MFRGNHLRDMSMILLLSDTVESLARLAHGARIIDEGDRIMEAGRAWPAPWLMDKGIGHFRQLTGL